MSFKQNIVTPPTLNKNRSNPPPSERESGGAPSRGARGRRAGQLPALVRVFLSLLVAWHVFIVLMAPLSVSPSSRLVVDIAQRPPMQWYLDVLYLNHGYHFFAPEPSTGHLIRYQVMDDRGTIVQQGEFPNRKDLWPRLRYHRYFMLADQCELPLPEEADRNHWMRVYLTSYAHQLLRDYGGASVRVQRIVHYPAFIRDVQQGMPLDDPRTYETQLEVTQRREDLDLPPPSAGGTWNNWRQDVASGWQGGLR